MTKIHTAYIVLQMRLLSAVSVLAIALFTFSAMADEPTRISVSVSLSEDGTLLEGTVKIHIDNTTGQALETIPLWLYANRFQKLAPGLTDRNSNWIYPSGFSSGGTEISRLSWNEKPLVSSSVRLLAMHDGGMPEKSKNVIAHVSLPDILEPGASGTLTMHFSLTIPKRRGRLGTFDGITSLAGGWFPRPLTDLTGQDPTLPPNLLKANVRVALPEKRGAVLNDRIFHWTAGAQTLEALGVTADTLTLIVMDKMEITRRKLSFGEGVYVSRELMTTQPEWSDTRGRDENGLPKGMRGLGRINFANRALHVLDITSTLMRTAAPGCRLPKTVVMVEIPAWDHLVQAGSDSILVSNRLWRLVPSERVLSFHDIALARAVAERLAEPTVAAAEEDNSPHRHLISEILGSHYGDRFALETRGGMESMRDIVGYAAFIPYVDSLLYAPQIPFRESYSKSIEEEDALRDEPWRFMNRLPRGRRIAAKFVDLKGLDAAESAFDDYLANTQSFNELLARQLGDNTSRFRNQWYSEYPKVNYSIASVEDENQPDGSITHRVTLRRDGAEIVEPVTLKITDDDGETTNLVWSGEGTEGTVEWTSKAPVDTVILDPQKRLVEDPGLTEDHPAADNMKPLPWRPPLLTQLLLWGDAVTMEPFVQLGVAMRRQYNVTNSFYMNGSYTPRGYGGSVSYLRHFGPKRTLNSRTWRFGPTLSVTRYLEVDEAGIEMPDSYLSAGTMGGAGLFLGRDDRVYFFDPRSGWSFSSWVGYSAGKADDGRPLQVGSASGRLFGLWSPSLGHTFALYGGAMGLVGDPTAADLSSLSNRSVLRGFALDETYGRLGLYAVLEYRHNLFEATGITLPSFSTLDRFQGILFAGVGTMSWPSNYDGLFTEERVFAEVGLGLRLHILTFGISQYLLGLDLAFPVAPTDRSYEVKQTDGTTAETGRNPFKLVFGITQIY